MQLPWQAAPFRWGLVSLAVIPWRSMTHLRVAEPQLCLYLMGHRAIAMQSRPGQ